MAMVFCRGCGKEIHETAPVCPSCGAPQNLPDALRGQRSTGKLVLWAVFWWLVLWFASLFLAGAVAGMMNPQDPQGAGAHAGQVLSAPLFLIALCVSVVLTVFGKLPGPKKPAQISRSNT
jgi:hypothetical protein